MAKRGNDHDSSVEIDGMIKARTALAVLWDDGKNQAWLPLSQIELADDEKSILCPEWLAVDKGFA